MMLGNPGGAGIIPKAGNFSAIFNQTQIYQFTDGETSNKNTRVSLGLLLKSGLEVKIGRYLSLDNLSIDIKGI